MPGTYWDDTVMTRRRAFTLLEVIVATAILAVALASVATMRRVTRTSVRADRRWTAVSQLLDATMARLAATGHNSLHPRSGQPVPVRAEIRHIVPDVRVICTVTSAGAHLKTITLDATWQAVAGQPLRTAQLRAQIAARRRKGGGP